MKEKIKEILWEALAGFVFWTAVLTPYMVFVVKLSLWQFLKWLLTFIILTPALTPVFLRFVRFIKEKTR